MDLLHDLFQSVCGQPPDRTWLSGGVLLPVCQRCTGLYLGAALAAGLLWWLRPSYGPRLVWLHLAFLAGVAPFGMHWIEHGPAVRTMTGFLFGAAVVVLLAGGPLEWLGTRRRGGAPAPPHETADGSARPRLGSVREPTATRAYVALLGLGMVGTPGLCALPRPWVAWLLGAGVAAGGVCLLILVLLNGLAFGAWLTRQLAGLSVAGWSRASRACRSSGPMTKAGRGTIIGSSNAPPAGAFTTLRSCANRAPAIEPHQAER